MKKETLTIEGMMCVKCKAKVEKAIEEQDGVNAFEVNLDAGNAEIEYDEAQIQISDIAEAITKAGFEAKQ